MPEMNNNQLPQYYARDRKEWRTWLEKNSTTSPGVWLIYYKQQSGQPRVSYEEAVEEALCFGWIDSRPNAIDDERYMQLFSPRKARSPWSKINKERVEKLIEQGLMTEAGYKAIETAKQNGFWSIYDGIEAQTMPEDFVQALAANPTARQNFEAFSDSSKKQLLWHIESAKRPETRLKRIGQIVEAAAQNINPLQYNVRKKP
jgi:uncharacterized protein YdeI (YjbR/CyaY-like superfamily)